MISVLVLWTSFFHLCAVEALATADERTLTFKVPIPDKALPRHVIRTEQVPNEGSCRVKCYLDPNCVSINVGPGTEGQLTCELNNHTDDSPSHSLLEERKHYIHYSVEDFCHGDPCPENVSVCQVGFTNKGYRCACHKGYIATGDHGQCEDLDECSTSQGGNNCSPDAECMNTLGSFDCSCRAGFTGDGVVCNADVNECNSSPCHNGGNCTNQNGTYGCTCTPAWTGKKCGVDVDECSSFPCENGGTCINRDGGFECSCTDEWIGTYCETGRIIICEDRQREITCSGGRKIQVLFANYGRLDNHTCPYIRPGHQNKTDCRATISEDRVRSHCQSQTSCVIKPNRNFFNKSDPCPGIYKYLLIVYLCEN